MTAEERAPGGLGLETPDLPSRTLLFFDGVTNQQLLRVSNWRRDLHEGFGIRRLQIRDDDRHSLLTLLEPAAHVIAFVGVDQEYGVSRGPRMG